MSDAAVNDLPLGEQQLVAIESRFNPIAESVMGAKGSMQIAGLQFYGGAFSDGKAQYAQKVMAERSRLEVVLRGGG